jgi:branched-chain amino acid transport system substrate-binding protein
MSDSNLSRALAEVERVNADAGDDALSLGVLTPLTGPGDPVAGELIVRGACLGVEYVREHGGVRGGRQFRLVVENDQATAAEEGMQRSAVAGLAKLAMVDEVLALLGQWHLRTAGVVVETAERLGVPIFVENGHSTITAERRRTLFRTYFTIADRMPLLLRFLAEQGLRRVAVLGPNTVFGLMMADTLEEQAPAHGEFELLRFDFDQETTTTVHPQLEEVRDWRPDVVVNCGVVRTNYMVLNEAAEVGLRPDPPMVVTFPFPLRSDDYWRLAGEAGNLVVWPATHYRPSWSGLTEIGRWFTERYAERHGSFPPDNSLSAFTDVTIVAQALERASGEGREDLLAALENGSFDTWRGPVRFERGPEHWHHSPPELVLMQYHEVGQSFDDAAIVYPPEARTHEYVAPERTAGAS